MLEAFVLTLALSVAPTASPLADSPTMDDCSSISDNDMRYFCQGSCSSISTIISRSGS